MPLPLVVELLEGAGGELDHVLVPGDELQLGEGDGSRRRHRGRGSR